MKTKPIHNYLKQFPLWQKIVGSIAFVIFILVASFVGYFIFWNYDNKQAEKLIDQKFHQEIAHIPQLKVTHFKLWEGDSMVEANIENKGEIGFWYGRHGIPTIKSLGRYSTSYTCFYVDGNGKKTGYAFDTGLVLDKEGKYAQWFPFQVNNLNDLVEKYDAITAVVATFPKDPERVPFEDRWGKREVIKESNPEYVLKQQYKGKEVWCDLHQ